MDLYDLKHNSLAIILQATIFIVWKGETTYLLRLRELICVANLADIHIFASGLT
jgi:hypothetical protein